MALGKIKADTLEHSTAGSVDTKFVVNGSAKVFSVVDATASNAILKSFNISSISDIDVGIINNSFTNNMADANYHNLASADVNTVAPCTGATASSYDTTSSARAYAYRTDTSALVDQDKIGPLIHGDLA